jgi:hypothetical protein
VVGSVNTFITVTVLPDPEPARRGR